jgi:hypothetical protein
MSTLLQQGKSPFRADTRNHVTAASFEQEVGERPTSHFTICPQAIEIEYPILGYFTAKSLYRLTRNLTLNQRVQGSSPCAPTSPNLYGPLFGSTI